MKNLKLNTLILVFTMGIFGNLIAQMNIDHIFSEIRQSKIYKNINVDNHVYTASSIHQCFSPTLANLTENNIQYWTDGEPGYWFYNDLVYFEEENLIITTGFYREADDVGSIIDLPHILGFQLDGTLLFNTVLSFPPGIEWHNLLLDLAISSDGKVMGVMSNVIYLLSANGEHISTQTLANSEFLAIEKYNDQHMVILGKDVIFLLGNDGNFTDSLELISSAIDMWVADQTIWILGEDNLTKIVDFNNQTSAEELYNVITPTAITGNSENLFVIGEPLEGQGSFSTIVQLNPADLSILNQSDFPVESTTLNSISATAEQLVINGNSST